MADTNPTTPAPATNGRAEAITALDAILAGPSEGTPAVVGEAGTVAPVTTSADAVDAKAGEDKGAAPPDPVQAQDLEWAPEKIRPLLVNATPEQIEDLKRSVLRHRDYTKKTQEVAEERKRVETLLKDAENWRRLLQNPDAAKAAMDRMEGKQPEGSEPEEDFDILTAAPKQQREYIARLAREEAKRMAAAEVSERVDKPQAARAQIGEAVNAWALDKGLTETDLAALAPKVAALAQRHREAITAENVVGLFETAQEIAALSKSKPAAGNGAPGLAKVASPNGRGSTAVSPLPVPKYSVEKRGPQTRAEGLEMAKIVARDGFGLDLTDRGLEDWLNTIR